MSQAPYIYSVTITPRFNGPNNPGPVIGRGPSLQSAAREALEALSPWARFDPVSRFKARVDQDRVSCYETTVDNNITGGTLDLIETPFGNLQIVYRNETRRISD